MREFIFLLSRFLFLVPSGYFLSKIILPLNLVIFFILVTKFLIVTASPLPTLNIGILLKEAFKGFFFVFLEKIIKIEALLR